jgi:hypothetical protein
MRNGSFFELFRSVREGGAILEGKGAPSRAFEVKGPGAKERREAAEPCQPERSLAEDEADREAFAQRRGEPTLSFDAVVRDLRHRRGI